MKVLVITGFLGAGKTTFIKALARLTGREFVILENDSGRVNIDRRRLADSSSDIWELTEGCACCTGASDFASSVLTIANTVDPDYLIVEPSGVAQLSRVMNNLAAIAYERIELLKPVVVVDPTNPVSPQFSSIVNDQISSAGVVVFSRTENSSVQEKSLYEDRIRRINPGAAIVADHYSGLTREAAWKLFFGETIVDGNYEFDDSAVPEFETFTADNLKFKSIGEFDLFIRHVMTGNFGMVARVKGEVRVGDEILSVDASSSGYEIRGEGPDGHFLRPRTLSVVFIGCDIDSLGIRRYVTVYPNRVR